MDEVGEESLRGHSHIRRPPPISTMQGRYSSEQAYMGDPLTSQDVGTNSPGRKSEGRVVLKNPKSPSFRMKADGRYLMVSTQSSGKLAENSPSGSRSPPTRIKRGALEVTSSRRDLRVIRSAQSVRRVSDILSRISQMKTAIDGQLLERSLSVEAHNRIIRKWDAGLRLVEAVMLDIRKSKTMSLVERDRHDIMLHKTVTEALSVLHESTAEGGALLHGLRNSIVDAGEWLEHVEDELERVSQGTVVLAMADASELQPLFEALYSRWCWQNGAIGRIFKAWRVQVDGLLLVRDKAAMEKIVVKLRTISLGSLSRTFGAWVQSVKSKLRKLQLKTRMILTNMFSDKIWAFRKWRTYFIQSVRSRNILDKIEFRMQLLSWEHWTQCSLFRKFRQQKKRFADRLAFKRRCGLHFHAWAFDVMRQKTLQVKLLSAKACIGFKLLSRCVKRWASLQKNMIYRRRELAKARGWRLSRHLHDWKAASCALSRQDASASLIRRRVEIRAAEEGFQNWCDAIEIKIVRRIRREKFQAQCRISRMQTIFRRWFGVSNITQQGLTNYRIKRVFQRLQRQVQVSKTVKSIFGRWTDLSDKVSVERCFNRLRSWFEQHCDALDILSKVAREAGVLELDTAFFRWKKKEIRHRLKRFRMRWLARHHHLGIKNFFFVFWVRRSISKYNIADKQCRQAIRLGLRRRDFHLMGRAVGAMGMLVGVMRSGRHRAAAVWGKTRWRRLLDAMGAWHELMKQKEVVKRMAQRLARRSAITWLRLFRRIAHDTRLRITYGHYCPECKRPLGLSRGSASRGPDAQLASDAASSLRRSSSLRGAGSTRARSASRSRRSRSAERRRRSIAQCSLNSSIPGAASERREYRPPPEHPRAGQGSRAPSRPQGPQRSLSGEEAREVLLEFGHDVDGEVSFEVIGTLDHDFLQDQVSDALATAYEELQGALPASNKKGGDREASSHTRLNISVSDAFTKASIAHRTPSRTHVTVHEANAKWHRDLRRAQPQPPSHSPVRSPTRPRAEAWEQLKGGLGIGLRNSLPQPTISPALQASPLARMRPKSAYTPSSTGKSHRARLERAKRTVQREMCVVLPSRMQRALT